MKLTNTKKSIILFCVIVLFIILFYICYKYFSNEYNSDNIQGVKIIESFFEGELTVQEYIKELQICLGRANEFIALIDPCKKMIDNTNESVNYQNSGMNIYAQESSDKAKCLYNKISKYLNTYNIDLINEIPELNAKILHYTDKLKNYINNLVLSAVNANTDAQNLVASTQNTANQLKQILDSTPPADPTQINNLTSTVNTEQTMISQMKQTFSSKSYSPGLFYTVSAKYHNDDVAFFNNSPPLLPTTYGSNSLSNQGTGIMMIGAPDGYAFQTDSGMRATRGRSGAAACIINGDGQFHCSICNSTSYNGHCIPDNDSWEKYSVEWVGYFFTGNYPAGEWTFYTVSDDESYLWIGPAASGDNTNPSNNAFNTGNCVVNNGGVHSARQMSGKITLQPNQYYPFRYQFGENYVNDAVLVYFTTPGSNTKTINGSGFYFCNQHNPQSNRDPGPTYQPGLWFHIVDGYMNSNVNWFMEGTPRYMQTSDAHFAIENGPSTGYTQSLTDICASTTTPNNQGKNFCLPQSNVRQFSTQWVGFLFTKDIEASWTFNMSSSGSAYFWIASDAEDSAEGNGTSGSYTSSNAKIKGNGSFTVALSSNMHYPIRILNGQLGGSTQFSFTITGLGNKTPDLNNTGYYFHNSNNPNDNTMVYDPSTFLSKTYKYLDNLASLANLKSAYAKENATFNAVVTNYDIAITNHNSSVTTAGQAYTNMLQAQNFASSLEQKLNADINNFKTTVYNIFNNINSYNYVDRFKVSYVGIDAYVHKAYDTPYQVNSVSLPTDQGLCFSDKTDQNGSPLTQIFSDFGGNGYCYYGRTDAKSVLVNNPGQINNNFVRIDVEEPAVNCQYDDLLPSEQIFSMRGETVRGDITMDQRILLDNYINRSTIGESSMVSKRQDGTFGSVNQLDNSVISYSRVNARLPPTQAIPTAPPINNNAWGRG